MSNPCPLCKSESTIFFERKERLYHQCNTCFGIFVDKSLLPDPNDEKMRYEEHNNDVEDKGYQNFVSPITNSIISDFKPQHIGLDFGAGTGPVAAKILSENKYNVKLYDPFFHYQPKLLKCTYDYIICSEVMEHFHNPKKEFILLKSLLKPNGKLYCFTHIYDPNIKFDNWYYKNDLTHVFFYHLNSLKFIKENFGFTEMHINKKLIIFST